MNYTGYYHGKGRTTAEVIDLPQVAFWDRAR